MHDGVTRVNALNLARSIFNFLNLSTSFLRLASRLISKNARQKCDDARDDGSDDGNCAVTRLRDQNSHCTYYYCFRYRCKYQRGWRRNNDRRKGQTLSFRFFIYIHVHTHTHPRLLSINAR